jgi:hypothetical protein
MINATDTGIIGARGRALILLGFAGAFGRSELVRLKPKRLCTRQGRPDEDESCSACGPRSRQVRRPFAPGWARHGRGDRNASERSIMKQTGHRSVQMVRGYIRDGNLFRENSAGKLGL